MLRVYLTGNVAIEDGDVLVPEKRFPGPQGRLTFAILAWERQRAISVDGLADAVWSGAPPDGWQTALRALVSKVRSAVGQSASIEHAFGCYQLRLPPDAWVDVEACDAALHEAESAIREGEHDVAMGSALVANAIARRPFLAGDPSEWAERRREHLRRVRVRALEARGRVALAQGDPAGAASDAEIVLSMDPLRESACVLLMQANVAAGNPAHAAVAYERLRARLAEELGTSPSRDTQAAFLDLLSAGVTPHRAKRQADGDGPAS